MSWLPHEDAQGRHALPNSSGAMAAAANVSGGAQQQHVELAEGGHVLPRRSSADEREREAEQFRIIIGRLLSQNGRKEDRSHQAPKIPPTSYGFRADMELENFGWNPGGFSANGAIPVMYEGTYLLFFLVYMQQFSSHLFSLT